MTHKNRKSCERHMATICHCLARKSSQFYKCCGWYCNDCGGRVNGAGDPVAKEKP